jgi:CO/xanthine dehydrogenase Mo-binding subunit
VSGSCSVSKASPSSPDGKRAFIDDLAIDDCLWGMTVRSPAARGRIRKIKFDPSIDWSQFVVVDHRDIPGPNEIYLIENDQPVLAGAEVRHVHESVVLVAHPSRRMVRRAVEAIAIEIDPLEPVFDFRATPAPSQIQYGDDNVLSSLRIEKGDIDKALASAAHVIENVFETAAQEHVYLENQGMAAWVEDGVLVVQGSMQCPYYVHNALKHALKRDGSQLRVVHAPTGGGFGGKEDYPSNLALHVALLALKAGRPVKIVYDRGEDMAATTKRHPARVRHRTGVDRDGRLVAQEIDVLLDAGAYVTLSPVVLSRACIHAAGPYMCENVRIMGAARLTNHVPFGAFRGFGAPQTQFANERQMDAIARTLGIDPVEIRRVNLIREGQTTSTGQVIADGVDRVAVMEAALDVADYQRKKAEHGSFNATHPYLRRGLGLATFYHGAGFTGAGEVHLKSQLQVAGLPDGRVEVLSANTEIGQGTLTILTQIAADRLGYDRQDVVIALADTSRVPNSGPTVASRTAMIVGRLVEDACDKLRAAVGLDCSARGSTVKDAIARWHQNNPGGQLKCEARYQRPPGIHWDEEAYRGDAYQAFAWAAYIAPGRRRPGDRLGAHGGVPVARRGDGQLTAHQLHHPHEQRSASDPRRFYGRAVCRRGTGRQGARGTGGRWRRPGRDQRCRRCPWRRGAHHPTHTGASVPALAAPTGGVISHGRP